MHNRFAWLGLTPDPERTLPELLADLDVGTSPYREQCRVLHLVLRGSARRWSRYLDRAAEMALAVAGGAADGDTETALEVARVVLEHDRMLIGLPGGAYHRATERRRRLSAAVPVLEARLSTTDHLAKELP